METIVGMAQQNFLFESIGAGERLHLSNASFLACESMEHILDSTDLKPYLLDLNCSVVEA